MNTLDLDFEMVRNDDVTKVFEFTLNGDPYGFSGSTVVMNIKESHCSTETKETITGAISINQVTFEIPRTVNNEAGSFVYDIEETKTGDKKVTLVLGTITVSQDVE